MESTQSIRCRVAACREELDDGKAWSFYLINDSAFALDSALLYEIDYEWGDIGNSEETDIRVTDLAPGAHALMWRDDGSGAEVRMDLRLRVTALKREADLRFEFPKLYLKQHFEWIDALGRPAWQVCAEG